MSESKSKLAVTVTALQTIIRLAAERRGLNLPHPVNVLFSSIENHAKNALQGVDAVEVQQIPVPNTDWDSMGQDIP